MVAIALGLILTAASFLAPPPARAQTTAWRVYLPILQGAGPPLAGLALADPSHPEDLARLNAQWWYDWTDQGQVPMLWAGNLSSRIPANYTGYILVFNEPNLAQQANLTPQEAARRFALVRAAYPQARLLCCGVSAWAVDWVQAFLAAGGRPDGWHVHAYTEDWITPAVAQKYLIEQHDLTGGAYWISEYGSPVGNLADFQAMTDWFATQPWIERIAAYTNRQPPNASWALGSGVDMVNTDGSLSPIGAWYAALRSGQP